MDRDSELSASGRDFLDGHEFLRALLGSSHSVVIVLDREARVLGCSPAAEETLGRSEKQLLGRLAWKLLSNEEVDEVRRSFERSLDGESTEPQEGYWVRPDGDQTCLSWSTVPLVSDGQVQHVVWVGVDITRNLRAEEARQESVHRYQAIVDAAAEGIAIIDERGFIDAFNPSAERMFGYRAHEVIGRNVSMLMPSPFRDEHDEYLERYLETGVAKIIGIGREVVGVRKDGSYFPMDLAISEVQDGDRRYFAGILRDISERKLAEKNMVQQEKLVAVGQLASGVAHEVGNPLASISAVVQGVIRKIDEPALIERLRLVEKHIHRISNTLQEMVRFSRPPQAVWARCNLNDVIRDAIAIVRHDNRARRTAINLELSALPETYAMPDLLSQVFLNLALNAFDAVELAPELDAPELTVTSRSYSQGAEARIEVVFEDNGVGIAPEVVPRLIEPFFTTKDVGRGTGLGLAVSYRVVVDHGGQLRVEGRLGEGARFFIDLPVYERPPTATGGLGAPA